MWSTNLPEMKTSQGNTACSQSIRSGNQRTDGDARPKSGMVKAALPETQSLGLKHQGEHRLIDALTEEVYRS
jgi:hypothetical protein